MHAKLPSRSATDPRPLLADSRYYVNEKALEEHVGTAKHKRRENKLKKEKIYDAAEANAAAGRAPPDNGLRASMDVAMVSK